MNSHVAKSMIRSPLDFGWRESKCGLIPLFFEGPIASDFFYKILFLREEENRFVQETVYATDNICTVLHKCLPLRKVR